MGILFYGVFILVGGPIFLWLIATGLALSKGWRKMGGIFIVLFCITIAGYLANAFGLQSQLTKPVVTIVLLSSLASIPAVLIACLLPHYK